ncbi:hypothetical protein FIBSPDRAFT_854155, partial [Athelia psychrophila]
NDCVFHLTGGNDKQGFPMKHAALFPYRVKLLCDGHSCYRSRRTDDPGRKSVRGCIVNTIIIGIVKQGGTGVPGLTGNILPKRLGPKPAIKIRRLSSSSQEDDVSK